MCHNLRTIVLSVILRFTASDYPFGIFKHFLSYDFPLAICFVFVSNKELILLYSICLLKIIHTRADSGGGGAPGAPPPPPKIGKNMIFLA